MLAPHSQQERVQKTKEVLNTVIETICPEGAQELKQTLLKTAPSVWMQGSTSPQVSAVLSSVADAFRVSETRQECLQALSLVADSFPFAVLQEYIPGVTKYMFTQARYYAALLDKCENKKQTQNTLDECDKRSIWAALDFIASDLVSMPAPFGTSKMKLSSGEQQEIDLYIRQQSMEHIYHIYKTFMEQISYPESEHETASHQLEGTTNGPNSNIPNLDRSEETKPKVLSRSLFLQILKKCPAKTRHSIHGLDSYTFGGLEATDSLINEIENWRKLGLVGKEWAEEKKGLLHDAKTYLRSDYKVHISESSRVADHCARWALSDPKKQEFQATCTHEHNLQCPRCQNIQHVLSEIDHFVKTTEFSNPGQKDEVAFIFEKAAENMYQWKGHQLRTVHQDSTCSDIWERLQENEVYIVIDYAMKWLPTAGREPQTAWFGRSIILSFIFSQNCNYHMQCILCNKFR